MQVNKDGKKLLVSIEGSIGETSPIYGLQLAGASELVIDMNNVTTINSIGVKNWVSWVLRLPKDLIVKLTNCPHVIVSQASMVAGFTSERMTIESVKLPYLCENCNYEEIRFVNRGVDYQYSSPQQEKFVRLPSQQICPKCKKPVLEADTIIEKNFKFVK